jgi:hypothetical protein
MQDPLLQQIEQFNKQLEEMRMRQYCILINVSKAQLYQELMEMNGLHDRVVDEVSIEADYTFVVHDDEKEQPLWGNQSHEQWNILEKRRFVVNWIFNWRKYGRQAWWLLMDYPNLSVPVWTSMDFIKKRLQPLSKRFNRQTTEEN